MIRFALAIACTTIALLACESSSSSSCGDASDQADAVVFDGSTGVAVPLLPCSVRIYAANVTVGTQTFSLVVDTGSTTLAVAAQGCASCVDAGITDLYQPGSTATDEHATASATYGTLSTKGWSGEIYDDTVSVGPLAAPVRLVAIQQDMAFLPGLQCGSGSTAAIPGVVGFARSPAATAGTTGFFDDLVAAGQAEDVFATMLCPNGGTLWLGGYDPSFTTAPFQWAPWSCSATDPYFYSVDIASIAAAGTSVPIATGAYTGALFDTGSEVSTLPTAAFRAVTSAIASSPSFAQVFGASTSSMFANPPTCATLSQTKAELDATLPSLTFTFAANPAVQVNAVATESYLSTTGSGVWCSALFPLDPSGSFPGVAAHLGAPFLSSSVVVFDRANQRVGFAPHAACP